MPSIFGRAIIETPTNKSGGALAKGDVVVLDTANDYAVTTTTTGATTVTVGVVVEENGIASNATGRVQFGGYVGLVNVNASVTRGHYGTTYTVAKQATDGGASRIVGAFCVFLTGGSTPTAHLFVQPDGSSAAGNVATDPIWDVAGDLAVGSGANTAARLAISATAGAALSRVNGAVAWNSGTAMPTAEAGDRFWRTDLGMEFYYDGTRWVTTTLYRMGFFVNDSVMGSGFSVDSTVGMASIWAATGLYLDSLYVSYRTGSTNDGSKYWTYKLRYRDSANTGSDIVSANTSADAINTWFAKSHSIAAVMSTNARVLDVQALKTSTPTPLPLIFELAYRVIGT